ncbi:ROK family protein [Deinococcus sp.]|uniref:ROK family protein n=1 Tax=Deinococcus sp. TaxID=47478 RepID=UPI003C7E07ED
MPVLALDFGGTTIKLGLLEQGRLLAQSSLPNTSRRSDLNAVLRAVAALQEQAGIGPEELLGVGLSLPGIVDPGRGRLLSLKEKYGYGLEMNWREWAEASFALPCVIENDARAATIGEARYGVARGCDNLVMMILGTGIGSGALIGGRLLGGAHHQAGILGGHFVVEAGGYLCNCGNRGCLEVQAGSWNMPRIARDHPDFAGSRLAGETRLDFQAFCRAAQAGDAVGRELVARLARYWAIGLINLIHAYDPEKVVLSGGLLGGAHLFEGDLRAYVRRHAWTPWGTPEILFSRHPEASVLLGLDYLLRQHVGAPCGLQNDSAAKPSGVEA